MQMFEACSGLRIMMSGCAVAEVKGVSAGGADMVRGGGGKSVRADLKGKGLIVPLYSLIQSEVLRRGILPEAEVSLDKALDYLRRDPVVLPGAPSGYVILTYRPDVPKDCAMPIGLVKNLGNRCNSLLPPSIALRKR